MAFKIILRYLLTLIITVIIGGLALYVLDPLMVNDDNNNMLSSLGFAFVFIFVTYNIYLLMYGLLLKNKAYRLYTRGIFCFVLENLLWLILLASLAGFRSGQFMLNMFGVGTISFFLPYLHNFITVKLGLRRSVG